jgi:hypothetical protein
MPPTVVMEHFAERYDIDYLILDLAYVTPERLHIFDWVTALEQHGSIELYELVRRPRCPTKAGDALGIDGSSTPRICA